MRSDQRAYERPAVIVRATRGEWGADVRELVIKRGCHSNSRTGRWCRSSGRASSDRDQKHIFPRASPRIPRDGEEHTKLKGNACLVDSRKEIDIRYSFAMMSSHPAARSAQLRAMPEEGLCPSFEHSSASSCDLGRVKVLVDPVRKHPQNSCPSPVELLDKAGTFSRTIRQHAAPRLVAPTCEGRKGQ